MFHRNPIVYADDDFESIPTLVRLRLPSLAVGLILGLAISFVTSGFEEVLSRNIQVAFFIPFIVYISDALGTQTAAIYSRDLKSSKARFATYLRKESMLGIIFGLIFSLLAGGVTSLWIDNDLIALSVGLATFFSVASAPIVALCITEFFQLLHKDPAAGSGPIATVVQDMISIVIYGIISSIILL